MSDAESLPKGEAHGAEPCVGDASRPCGWDGLWVPAARSVVGGLLSPQLGVLRGRRHRPEPGVPLLSSCAIALHTAALIFWSKGLKNVTQGNDGLTFLPRHLLSFSDCLECPLDVLVINCPKPARGVCHSCILLNGRALQRALTSHPIQHWGAVAVLHLQLPN